MAELSLYTINNKLVDIQTALTNNINSVNATLNGKIDNTSTTLTTLVNTTKQTLNDKVDTINTNLTNSINTTNSNLETHNHNGQTLNLGGLKLKSNYETGWAGWDYVLELDNGSKAMIVSNATGLGIGFNTDGGIYFADYKNQKYLATLNNNGVLSTIGGFNGTASYATSAGNCDTVDGKHASDLATAGHHHDNTTLDSIDWTKILNKPTSYKADYVLNDNGYMQFHWSGQQGQPSWLWGGNDGTNMYAYNPSNFTVNKALNIPTSDVGGNIWLASN